MPTVCADDPSFGCHTLLFREALACSERSDTAFASSLHFNGPPVANLALRKLNVEHACSSRAHAINVRTLKRDKEKQEFAWDRSRLSVVSVEVASVRPVDSFGTDDLRHVTQRSFMLLFGCSGAESEACFGSMVYLHPTVPLQV